MNAHATKRLADIHSKYPIGSPFMVGAEECYVSKIEINGDENNEALVGVYVTSKYICIGTKGKLPKNVILRRLVLKSRLGCPLLNMDGELTENRLEE